MATAMAAVAAIATAMAAMRTAMAAVAAMVKAVKTIITKTGSVRINSSGNGDGIRNSNGD